MTIYAYHSDDHRFPGPIDLQKQQWPDARWFPTPARVSQQGKFSGGGGLLVGMLPDQTQIQLHDGVLVALNDFETGMARVRRARGLRGRIDRMEYERRFIGKPTNLGNVVTGEESR